MNEERKLRVIVLGDVVGKPGRLSFKKNFPKLKEHYQPDLVIINGENLAGGFGVTEKLAKTFFEDYGVDVITTGNHWHDKVEIFRFGERYPNLLLPANMYNVSSSERGYYIGKTRSGITYAVINLIGQVFMKGDNSSPFDSIDKILRKIPQSVSFIFLDIHAETTSEKQALGHYLKDKVSLVYGTHTHCQTSDETLLSPKTAYITDVGMTGGSDSVIGMDKDISIFNFKNFPRKTLKPAENNLQLCALFAEFDLKTKFCSALERLRVSEREELKTSA